MKLESVEKATLCYHCDDCMLSHPDSCICMHTCLPKDTPEKMHGETECIPGQVPGKYGGQRQGLQVGNPKIVEEFASPKSPGSINRFFEKVLFILPD